MAIYATGIVAFDTAAAIAEGVRQASLAAATTQALATAADKLYFQTVIAAGVTNGVVCVNEQLTLNAIIAAGG